MNSNKRGLSEIVSTILILLIVFIAIGLVWAIIKGINPEGMGCQADCISADLAFAGNSVTCNDSVTNDTFLVDATVERESDNLENLKLMIVVGGNSSYTDTAPSIFGSERHTNLYSDVALAAGSNVVVKLVPLVSCKGGDSLCKSPIDEVTVTCLDVTP